MKATRHGKSYAFRSDVSIESVRRFPVNIAYHRKKVSGNPLTDYVVDIAGGWFVFSPVVNGPSSEESLDPVSGDQVVLKRQDDPPGVVSTRAENVDAIDQGKHRVQADLGACQMHLRTTDANRCLPALWTACQYPGASASHAKTPSLEWV